MIIVLDRFPVEHGNFRHYSTKIQYIKLPSMDILVRYWQELQDVMVRSYQESHVPKKTFIVKSYLERKKSERTSTKINNSADLYRYTLKLLLAIYKI